MTDSSFRYLHPLFLFFIENGEIQQERKSKSTSQTYEANRADDESSEGNSPIPESISADNNSLLSSSSSSTSTASDLKSNQNDLMNAQTSSSPSSSLSRFTRLNSFLIALLTKSGIDQELEKEFASSQWRNHRHHIIFSFGFMIIANSANLSVQIYFNGRCSFIMFTITIIGVCILLCVFIELYYSPSSSSTSTQHKMQKYETDKIEKNSNHGINKEPSVYRQCAAIIASLTPIIVSMEFFVLKNSCFHNHLLQPKRFQFNECSWVREREIPPMIHLVSSVCAFIVATVGIPWIRASFLLFVLFSSLSLFVWSIIPSPMFLRTFLVHFANFVLSLLVIFSLERSSRKDFIDTGERLEKIMKQREKLKIEREKLKRNSQPHSPATRSPIETQKNYIQERLIRFSEKLKNELKNKLDSIEEHKTSLVAKKEVKFDDFSIQSLAHVGKSMKYRALYKFNKPCIVEVPVFLIEKDDEDTLDIIQRLISISTEPEHKNVVKFIGYCWEPYFCLLWEYFPKGNLFDLLQSDSAMLTWDYPLKKISVQILEGLAHFKENHPTADLIRFSTKKVMLESGSSCKVDVSGKSILSREEVLYQDDYEGSTHATLIDPFCPPEQVLKSNKKKTQIGNLSLNDDQNNPEVAWVFGVCLWEILCRKQFVSFKDTKLPSTLPIEVPKEIRDLVRSCLLMEPHYRPCISDIFRVLKSGPLISGGEDIQIPDSEDDVVFHPFVPNAPSPFNETKILPSIKGSPLSDNESIRSTSPEIIPRMAPQIDSTPAPDWRNESRLILAYTDDNDSIASVDARLKKDMLSPSHGFAHHTSVLSSPSAGKGLPHPEEIKIEKIIYDSEKENGNSNNYNNNFSTPKEINGQYHTMNQGNTPSPSSNLYQAYPQINLGMNHQRHQQEYPNTYSPSPSYFHLYGMHQIQPHYNNHYSPIQHGAWQQQQHLHAQYQFAQNAYNNHQYQFMNQYTSNIPVPLHWPSLETVQRALERMLEADRESI